MAIAPRGKQAKQSPRTQRFRVGKLNLVDLAGSERVRLSGAQVRPLCCAVLHCTVLC